MLAPSAASLWQMRWPSPPLPPVTIATLFFRSMLLSPGFKAVHRPACCSSALRAITGPSLSHPRRAAALTHSLPVGVYKLAVLSLTPEHLLFAKVLQRSAQRGGRDVVPSICKFTLHIEGTTSRPP